MPLFTTFFTQIFPRDLWYFATLTQTESQSWQFFGPVNNDVNIVLMFTALLIIFNCRQNASTLRGPIFTAWRYICHATSSFFILHFFSYFSFCILNMILRSATPAIYCWALHLPRYISHLTFLTFCMFVYHIISSHDFTFQCLSLNVYGVHLI